MKSFLVKKHAEIKITLEWLIGRRVCEEAQKLFAERFPEGSFYPDVLDALANEYRCTWAMMLSEWVDEEELERKKSKMEITLGRYQLDGKIIVITGIAQHTEGDYRLVVFHPEGKPHELKATPESVFQERTSAGTPRLQLLPVKPTLDPGQMLYEGQKPS